MSAQGIKDLKRHEGFRSLPYTDTQGHLTIGYGINLDAGITEEEAAVILCMRVSKLQGTLSQFFPWWNEITSERQDVLINMAYNLGVDGLLKFKRMLARVADKNYEGAAQEMRSSKWAVQVKERSTELIKMMIAG